MRLLGVLVICFLAGCCTAKATRPRPRPRAKQFKVYWNMPTDPCARWGFDYTSVKWKFVKNNDNKFIGNEISLFYTPGDFPRMHNDSGKLVIHNQGVPQAGNLTSHLIKLNNQINRKMTNGRNNGLAILDMEDWFPTWPLNTGTKSIYRIYSRELMQKANPTLTTWEVEEKAVDSFNKYAEIFLVESIRAAKAKRPKAVWGYYEFPYCDNYVLNKNEMPCSPDVRVQNEKYLYIYKEVDALFPYIYLYKGMHKNKRAKHIIGRVEEAYRVLRLSNLTRPVYPYANPTVTDSNPLVYLSREDLLSSLLIPKICGTNGVVMWGSSHWFNTKQKCAVFNDYLNRELGPAVNYAVDSSIQEAKQWLQRRGERTNLCEGW